MANGPIDVRMQFDLRNQPTQLDGFIFHSQDTLIPHDKKQKFARVLLRSQPTGPMKHGFPADLKWNGSWNAFASIALSNPFLPTTKSIDEPS